MIQKGNILEFSGGDSQGRFTVTLCDVIYSDPATVGRSTTVLNVTSDRWPKDELAIKISWPGSGRVSETDFLEEAEKTEGKWAVNHLPHVFYDKEVVFGKGSTLESVASLFEGARSVGGGTRTIGVFSE